MLRKDLSLKVGLPPNKLLSLSEVSYVQNQNSKKFSELENSDKINFLNVEITKMFNDKGQESFKKDILAITTRLLEAQNMYPNFSVYEIRNAFIKGIAGEYGEYYGINFSSLIYFFVKYKQRKSEVYFSIARKKYEEQKERTVEQIIIDNVQKLEHNQLLDAATALKMYNYMTKYHKFFKFKFWIKRSNEANKKNIKQAFKRILCTRVIQYNNSQNKDIVTFLEEVKNGA